MTGITSVGIGDSDFGGGGNGLLRSVVFLGDMGDNGSVDDRAAEFRSGGDEFKLSNETVWAIFGLTSLP